MPRPLHLIDAADTASRWPRDAIAVGDDWFAAARAAVRLRRAHRQTIALHTRDAAGLRVAALSPRDWPIVHQVWSRPTEPEASLLAWLDGRRLLTARCANESLQRRLLRGGLTRNRCVVDPRGEPFPSHDSTRSAVRASLALRDDHCVLLLSGPATWHSDDRDAALAAALIAGFEPNAIILVARRGRAALSMETLSRSLTDATQLRFSARSIDELSAAADALVLGPGDNCDVDAMRTFSNTARPIFAARGADALPPDLLGSITVTGSKPRELAAAIARSLHRINPRPSASPTH